MSDDDDWGPKEGEKWKIPRCGLCKEIMLPGQWIHRVVDEDSPLAFFAEGGTLRVHPKCVIKHHEGLAKKMEGMA